MDIVNKIIDYESGTLNEEETIELFQELLNTGIVWQLQGHYGRTARVLFKAGYIK